MGLSCVAKRLIWEMSAIHTCTCYVMIIGKDINMRRIFIMKIRVGIVFLLLLNSCTSLATDIPFDHVVLDSKGPKDPWAKMIGDINGDGFLDVIIGGRSGPLVWYSYPNWTKTTIADGGYKTVDGEAGDVDGDDDLDIVMGGLIWYENPLPHDNPAKNIWKAHKVANHPTHDIELGDLDKDGDLDIVTRNQSDFGHKAGNKIHIWLQDRDSKWTEEVINCPHGEGIALGDIDKDADLDVVIGGIWFENNRDIVNGAWIKHRFADWHPSATVQIADINGDTRPDIVLSPSELKEQFYKMSWFEAPSNPKRGNWTEHIIVEPIECVIHGLATVDINADGMIDVISSEMHQGADPDEVAVFVNHANGSAWTKQIISSRGSHLIQAADIGSDGDMDIIGANWSGNYQPIEMWENKSKTVSSHGQGIHEGILSDLDDDRDLDIPLKPYNHNSPSVDVLLNQEMSLDKWKRHAITDLPDRAMFIQASDVDSDGHPDIIAGGWWWKNPGHLGGTWKQATIGEPLGNMAIVYDFDADGDPDILGTEGVGAAKNTNFVWAQNNGKGQFTIHKNINYTGGGDFLQGCTAARLGTTIRVALSWHRDGGGIHTLNVPARPVTDIWTTTLLSKTVSSPPQGEDLDFGDIDRDGDLDLLLGDLWLRNDGDTWATFRLGKITRGMPDRVDLADINCDGRLDAVVALEKGTDIWWFEAPDDPTDKWTQHRLGVIAGQGFSMDTTDLDGDGDPDVVIGEHRGKTENRVVLFENINSGSSWRPHVIDKDSKNKIDHHDGTQAVDLDNDGDLDIISLGWVNLKVWVYENLQVTNR